MAPRRIVTALALLAALPLAASCTKPSNIPMRIQLRFVSGEHSMDSHSYTYRVTIEHAKVTYYGPHEPCERGRCRHAEVTFTLSLEHGRRVAKALEALCLEFRQKQATGALGNYVQLELSGSLRGKKTAISIAGMTSRQRAASGPKLDDKALKIVELARRLKGVLRDAARSKMPKAL
ncbi:MAG: hypothetical protein KC503_14950 [Myxococcales bacterium]|nr:hypothetical protein [Myxococcales bacterium]